jgi:hypothetical protein
MSKTIKEILEANFEVNELPFDSTLMLYEAEILDRELPKSLSLKSKVLIASALGFSSAGYFDIGKKYGEKI